MITVLIIYLIFTWTFGLGLSILAQLMGHGTLWGNFVAAVMFPFMVLLVAGSWLVDQVRGIGTTIKKW